MDTYTTEAKVDSKLSEEKEHNDEGGIEGTLALLHELMDSVKEEFEVDCLETAIGSLQAILTKGGIGEEKFIIIHYHLTRAILTRYCVLEWTEDLDMTILLAGTVLRGRFKLISQEIDEIQVPAQLIQAFRSSINLDTLNTVICIATEALSSDANIRQTSEGADLMMLLGKTFVMKYLNSGDFVALDQAATKFQEADRIYTGTDQVTLVYKSLIFLQYVGLLQLIEGKRPEALAQLRIFLPRALELDREGSTLLDVGKNMATNAVDDTQLQEAIRLLTNSLRHRMVSHPQRYFSLQNLSVAHFIRFERLGSSENLEECIALRREVLDLCPVSHPKRFGSLNDLAVALYERFKHQGAFQDLEESIVLHQQALMLRPPPHPDRPMSLTNLANSFAARFREKEAVSQDLDDCISLHREALELVPGQHPKHSLVLNNLANALSTRFLHKGSLQDLEESIALHQKALEIRHSSHPDRSASLGGLAGALLTRFKQHGTSQDITECIKLYREAVTLEPSPHPSRCGSLHNLADALNTRFEQQGTHQDLEESVALLREALDLMPQPHPYYSSALDSLARTLAMRFKHKGENQDLEESIALQRKAINLLPSPSPKRYISLNNLAHTLSIRFERQKAIQDLDECVVLHTEALELLAAPHPSRCTVLNHLGNVYSIRLEQGPARIGDASTSLVPPDDHIDTLQPSSHGNDDDLENALYYYEAASKYEMGSLIERLGAFRNWVLCARAHRPTSTLVAYQSSIEFLPQLASLHLTLHQRQDVLRHIRELVRAAANCAINAKQGEMAVVFLSIGRSIFWSQALQLRTSVEELALTHPALADKFTTLSRDLESASYYTPHSFADSLAGSTTKKAYTSVSRLADERSQIIQEIRKVPGHEGFLMPPSFPLLQSAAKYGPIIFLNVSTFGCDAMIMQLTGSVSHIPLPRIQLVELVGVKILVEALSRAGLGAVTISPDRVRVLQSSLGRDMVTGYDSTGSNQDIFKLVLEWLWSMITEPVLNALGLEKTDSPRRIWWCPAGPFASLPFHAAGKYSDDHEPIDCVFQYAVSSYCTSPQDLLHPPPLITEDFKVTAIIEPEAPNAAILPATRKEMSKIENHVPDRQYLLTHIGSKESPNQIDDLLSDIQRSSFVHFGCHGMQNLENPLESHLLLSGGKLTMYRIIKECQVPEGALAYLSACETAKVDEVRPEESLNLVATMMFAGFRSVVGTLWSIFDDDAPVVADVFYRHLFRNGKDAPPDARDAAYGLHLATQELREQGKSFYSWVPHVHYGV